MGIASFISGLFGGGGSSGSSSSSKSSSTPSSGSSSSKPSSFTGNYNYNHNSSSYTQTQTGNKYSNSGTSSSGTTKTSFAGAQIGGTTAAQKVAEVTGKQTSTYTPPGTSTSTPTVSGAVSGVSTIKSTGTGGSSSGTAQTVNIPATPVQSNIAGTSSDRTWEMTYTNAATVNDPNRTTETWVSSDGMQVAFAGISASDLSDYYAERGDLENAAKFAEITAAGGTATSYGSTNWRNSSAGQAISLGTATTEQKLDAMKQGASASQVGLYGTTSTFETTPYYQATHPDEPTTKTLTTGDGGYIVTAGSGSTNIPTGETGGGGNIQTTTSSPDPTPSQDITIVIPSDEPSATGSGSNSGILDTLLSALFLSNLSKSQSADGGTDYQAYSPAADGASAEEEEPVWKKYALPIVIAVGVLVLAVVLSGDDGGKK